MGKKVKVENAEKKPRAWKAEEVQDQLLDYLRTMARYWASVDRQTSRLITDSKWRPANWQEVANQRAVQSLKHAIEHPDEPVGSPFEDGATAILDALLAEVTKSVEDRILGFIHSLLAQIDGEGMTMPAIDLVLRPHPDDREFHIKEGENWYRNGMAINANTYLHERLYEKEKKA